MLNKFILCFASVIVVVVLMSSAVARGTEYVSEDASWWASLPSDVRDYVVEGILTGIKGGIDNQGAFDMKLLSKGQTRLHLSYSQVDELEDQIMAHNMRFTKTFNVYENEVDEFYANHPSASSMSVGLVFECLADNSDMTCDQLARQ